VTDSEEMRCEGGPLRVQGAGKHRPAGLAVPIARVRDVTFLAVQVGMNPRRVGALNVLGNGVSAVPVAVRIVPKSAQQRRKR